MQADHYTEHLLDPGLSWVAEDELNPSASARQLQWRFIPTVSSRLALHGGLRLVIVGCQHEASHAWEWSPKRFRRPSPPLPFLTGVICHSDQEHALLGKTDGHLSNIATGNLCFWRPCCCLHGIFNFGSRGKFNGSPVRYYIHPKANKNEATRVSWVQSAQSSPSWDTGPG